MTLARLRAFFLHEPVLLGGYLLVILLVTVQNLLLPPHSFVPGGDAYPAYNNYLIFKTSFAHLRDGQNLYLPYPRQYWDLFKYAPTFALVMGGFATLPDWLGLALWNALNALSVFFGLKYLPYLRTKTTAKIRWFVLIELITSIQNSQANALILGLMLGAYLAWEKARPGWATLLLLAGACIKPFALAGGLLWFFFPKKGSALAWGIGWVVLLALLPAAVVGWPSLRTQYENWAALLQSDYVSSVGLSVRGWLQTWFGLTPANSWLTGVGVLLLLVPLGRVRFWDQPGSRRSYLAAILIWVVIFNHRAESPTFILAMAGVGIWYFSHRVTRLDRVLISCTFVLTSLSPTDLFPSVWREQFVVPYVLKAVGCIAIWLKIMFDLVLEPASLEAERPGTASDNVF